MLYGNFFCYHMSSNKKYGNITIKSLKYGNILSHMVTYHIT